MLLYLAMLAVQNLLSEKKIIQTKIYEDSYLASLLLGSVLIEPRDCRLTCLFSEKLGPARDGRMVILRTSSVSLALR